MEITPAMRRQARDALKALQDVFTPGFSSLLAYWEMSASTG